MTEPDDRKRGAAPLPAEGLRWQAFFQRARDPFFLLNRQRRFLFVNHAWEKLTGISAVEIRGSRCVRVAEPHDPWDVVVRAACCPTPEVLQGRPGRTQRTIQFPRAGTQWWSIDFLPLHDAEGVLCFLGRIMPGPRHGSVHHTLAELLQALHQKLAEKLSSENKAKLWKPEQLFQIRERAQAGFGIEHWCGQMPSLRRVIGQARLASKSLVPLLILGEPGTGKQWLARTIHQLSSARDKPFLALDCGRLPAEAVADVLWSPGALVQQGQVGTVYLREPSRLPRDLQQRLTEWLARAEPLDELRFMAGCSATPVDEIKSGRFLDDFYSTLATLVIALPPLRERPADLSTLVEQCLARVNAAEGQHIQGLTPAAWDLIRAHSWPGNLRELTAVLSAARQHAPSDQLDVTDFPAMLRINAGMEQTPGAAAHRALPLDQLLEEAERRLIMLALRKTRGNKTKAAELLAIWRPRLVRRMEALKIADPE